jgi:hypothetical protein
MRCADRCRRTAEAVKRESRKPGSRRATMRGAVEKEASTCPVCGTKLFAAAEGLSWIEKGIADWRANGSRWCVPYFLALGKKGAHRGGNNCSYLFVNSLCSCPSSGTKAST